MKAYESTLADAVIDVVCTGWYFVFIFAALLHLNRCIDILQLIGQFVSPLTLTAVSTISSCVKGQYA